MLTVVDIEFIRKRHFVDGWGIRKIAAQLEVSRVTVRKAIRSAEPWRYTLKAPRPCPVMDPFREIILTWLRDDKSAPRKQRHSAKRIYDRLCAEHGFTGSEPSVRRYVARLRVEVDGQTKVPDLVLAADAGEMAQVDWGQAKVRIAGVEQTVHIFCLRLRASGVFFVWAAPHERMEAFLEGHQRAFAWLGGVPRKVVYDNLSTAVRKVLAGHERELNARFVVLRSHYLFESVFCNPGAAQEKGSVEHLVGFAQRNFFTPIVDVPDFGALNDRLLAWCETAREARLHEWTAEAAALRPLPAGPFRACTEVWLPVNKQSLVTYQRNRYSVPAECIGAVVRADVYTDRLELWRGSECVARHDRATGRNQTALQLEHFLHALAQKPFAVTHAAVVRQLPEPYQELRSRLMSLDPSGYRELVRILLLHREFPAKAIEQALREALISGHILASDIRQTLLNGALESAGERASVSAQLRTIEVEQGPAAQYDTLWAVGA